MEIIQSKSKGKKIVIHIRHMELYNNVNTIVVLEKVAGFGFNVVTQDTLINYENACREFDKICDYWLDDEGV